MVSLVGSITHPTTAEFLIEFVVGAVVGAGLFLHADKHGSKRPTAWAIFGFFAPAIALGVYLVHRRRKRPGDM